MTAAPDPAAVKRAIRERALAEGFDAVGFAPADLAPEAAEHLGRFVAEGRHGDMGWLESTKERRGHPRALWADARSVVVLAQNYAPAEDPLALLGRPDRATISAYARGDDYHDVIKKKLRRLARWIHESHGVEVKLFVDTAPVMEKALAARSALGWQGKHTNLVSRAFGSWLFLAEIFVALDLPPDDAEIDHCGTCRRCLDVCPTAAFPAPYQLDATRCISYLTIEHKGTIPAALRPLIGNRVYGCDDCLAVCPWNKYAQAAGEIAFRPRLELTRPKLADFARLDDRAFRQVFRGSAIKRLGRDRFLRNVLIALGNSGDATLLPAVRPLLDDAAPVVRAMAVWALGRLAPWDEIAAAAHAHENETDGDVRAEWTALLREPAFTPPRIKPTGPAAPALA